MASRSLYNVMIIGAGEINFGSPEGPWNHTLRLERILGDRLRVLALIDPDTSRCASRIDEKTSSSPTSSSWSACRAFANIDDASTALAGQSIDLIVVGCPPHFRGTTTPGKDTDVLVSRAFPRAGSILVEKPVAAVDPKGGECHAALKEMHVWSQANGEALGVGYMLRYSKAVAAIREILSEHKLIPTCINARYFMAYEFARKLSWWDKSASCGPVVEQATHFVDLVRHIAGVSSNPALLDTVRATAVEHNEPAGALSKLGFDESLIEEPKRVPRVTTAFWKHQLGTIGTLCHGITLHGTTYDTELEVLADGWVMRLRDAYGRSPSLSIRRPGAAQEEKVVFEDDDPFYTQMATFVAASESREAPRPLSTYEDALGTYELTWQIRHASEERLAR
ncbi:uncharacterized protein PFL1_04234 [Pseudozyma flocculosa PF-1]|uniref:Gfo/Idh/MocA-like oxidoreductase N-terminal domain-containing protein n=2 Tax=Pseudozyma flocculosa TaxID=84751 RepID=A0A5C3EVP5_9BASI|nr:uncharacterized protein PFL1_04234 [Pseudozyma flocculosa PF-1]EPQ28407.1 hypothetical protein PFL1_04234 [Pseudozyma flocculosa PF-1]SPO35567.1 uncharacterized protein PSFLO_01038 [Pseudozyma flocculosa]